MKLSFKEVFKIKWDTSVYFLILANLITIALALIENWDFSVLLFIYWCQGAIIIFFCRILRGNNFNSVYVQRGLKGV